jgi:alpha-beta hydrolase superfamily lysophospholipase
VLQAQCFASMYHEIFNEPDAESAFTALETALAAVA